MQTLSVKDNVMQFITPTVEALGYELVDVEYAKKQNGMNLTLFIDSPNGVDLDGLEKVHKAVDVALDELDPTNGHSYILNCTSVGLDRPLKTDKDLNRNIGQLVDISLYAKLNGKKDYTGKLVEFSEDTITIEQPKENLTLERKQISKITKHIEF